ncbi:twin-arginine translocation signal domain-containing protein [Klebsiella pneumoniae]|nr:twin-arginine translocation signal domain-containing protein [Klebsiella pneumoniae]
MNRRRFLKSSMAAAAVCGTSGVASLFSQAAFAEDAGIADGQTRRFDYAVLQAMAHDLARQPWGGAPRDLPPTLANLTPQAYNSIQYDANHFRCGTILKSGSWTSSFSTSGWGSVAACGCSL